MSSKNKAVKAIVFIIFFNIATKFIGFYRDALIGRNLGAQYEADSYIIALSATTLIFLSISAGIATTVIPIIVKEQDKTKRREVIGNIFNIVLLLSLAIMFVYFASANVIVPFFAGGFTGEKLKLTITITRILVPTVIFINIAYLFVAVLQSNEKYILPTLISIPYNLIIIIYMFTAVKKFGILGLAAITVIGWTLQLLIQIPTIIKLKTIKLSYKVDFKSKEAKLFLKGLLPIVFVMATNQLATVTDNGFISYFDDGMVTTFYYGNMLFVAVVTIIVYGVTAVMFPHFNKTYAENKALFYESITNVLKGIILILIPVGVGLFILSDQLISFIFLSEKFTIDSVRLTSNFLKIYCTFMVAFGIMDIMNKSYYTKGDNKKPVLISIIILLSNFILNFIFTRVLHLGVYSIVFATAIAFYIGITVSMILFKSDEGNVKYKQIFLTIFKVAFSSIFMYGAIYILKDSFDYLKNPSSTINNLISMGLCAVVGILVYLVSLLALKEETTLGFINTILKRK